jgi:hypothetical protein
MEPLAEARAVDTRPVWWTALAVFLFSTVAFPIRTELLNRGLDGVFVAPDAMAHYDARSLADTFGPVSGPERGRRLAYAWTEVSLDAVFPVCYAAFCAHFLLAILPVARACRHAWGRTVWKMLALSVPVGAAVADWVENFGLWRIARSDAWERSPGDLDAISAAIAPTAHWSAVATGWKRGFLVAIVVLLAFALVRSGRLGRLVSLLWLARVPALALAALIALASLGGADRLSPTIPNMLAVAHPLQVAAVAFLASIAAMLAGFAALLVWELAPLRTGASFPVLPAFFSTRPTADPWRNAVFLFFAVPLVVRTVLRSGHDLRSWALAALLAIAGIALAVAALWPVRALRTLLVRVPLDPRTRRVFAWLVSRLGPGYENPATGGFLDGHGLAAGFAGAITVVYFAGWKLLDPGRSPAWCAALPTLGYVLGFIAILSALLAGAAFFFDRWRVPLVAIVLAWVALINRVKPMEHEFEWTWDPRPLPAAARAAEARLGQAPGKILTVVTASGGGIQAAAWTARVLTGLQEKLGAGFTRSIALVSSVSGGSVGTYFALTAMEERAAERGAIRGDALRGVVAAATESSLEPTAWGLVYPDLQRGLQPFVSRTRDRGWALERGWLAAANVHRLDPEGRRREFGDWANGAESGMLPAVVFNATRIDDGMPLRLATVGARDAFAASPEIADRPFLGLSRDFTYQYEDPVPGHLAIPAVTAARLSATFPYVSPIARPEPEGGDAKPFRLWHAADGGYFDNHGTVSALAWLYELQRAWGADFGGRVDRVLWIQIDAFPETDARGTDHAPGWTMSALGPLKGLLRVRTASQRVRRATELELEERLAGSRFAVVTLRPQPRTGPHRDAPMSWSLGQGDVERIEKEWQELVASGALAPLEEVPWR